MTHICVSKLTIIGSDNGLSPGRRQAIIWTNAGLLLIGPLGTNFSEILIKILTFSFKKMRLKVSSAKRRPFCLGLNVLTEMQLVTWRKLRFIRYFNDNKSMDTTGSSSSNTCHYFHHHEKCFDTSKLLFDNSIKFHTSSPRILSSGFALSYILFFVSIGPLYLCLDKMITRYIESLLLPDTTWNTRYQQHKDLERCKVSKLLSWN